MTKNKTGMLQTDLSTQNVTWMFLQIHKQFQIQTNVGEFYKTWRICLQSENYDKCHKC